MKQSTLYLWLCVPGVIVPWFFLAGFLVSGEATIPLFFSSIFVNYIASAVAADLIVSALVFFVFIFFEGRRVGVKAFWPVVAATLFVGLSFGLPLFLYLRARALEQNSG
jgi:hypothetical protein